MEFVDRNVRWELVAVWLSRLRGPFCHGFELQFEKATLQFELAALTDGVEAMT